MTVNRRQFLKLGASATLVSAFGGLGISLAPSVARADATVQQIGEWMSGLWDGAAAPNAAPNAAQNAAQNAARGGAHVQA
ncbi:twin-arginine translocation signal domain-containing protein [Delftia acidovorans]